MKNYEQKIANLRMRKLALSTDLMHGLITFAA